MNNTRAPVQDTLTVGELARCLRQTLDVAFGGGVWVAGEVDSINRTRSGHVYFNLVERPANQSHGAHLDQRAQREGGGRSANQSGGAPTAVVSVVLFRDDRQRVNNLIKRHGNAIRIADGVQVRIQAVVDFYAPRGQLQLRMTSIDPAHTLGAITAHRAAVVARLSQEGLLRRNATTPMTPVPLRVGLVTSLGSAAHADMLKVFEASGHAFCVTEVDTAVQGVDAPEAIAAALAAVAARVDVVLLARGGGSSTDLAAFDHEIVARAVAGCERPVLTGIGHETDRSAADEVAHTSCSTPTAAARAVVQRVDRWLERLEANARAIAHHSRRNVTVASRGLDLTALRLSQAARVATRRADLNLVEATRRLTRSGSLSVRLETGRLEALEARLKALDPASVLRRGWSLTRRADGTLVRSAGAVQPGDDITTHLADGVLTSTIRVSEADNDDNNKYSPDDQR